VPPNQERRLRFIGAWLQKYGEAIYATRALGLSQQPSWGYLTRSKSGDRIYCIVRRWPADGRLVVPISLKSAHASLLGDSAPLPVRVAHEVTVDLTGHRAPDRDASVVVLDVQ
jgi:alpha-L-fucosidase